MEIRIDTSGYHYKHWLGTYYPSGTKPSDMLAHYMRDFDTVELNRPFYRLHTRKVFEDWREAAPPGFVYAVKGRPFTGFVHEIRSTLLWEATMDDEYFQRWQNGKPPFDGLTVHPPVGPSIAVVRETLRGVVAHLENARPEAHLFRIADWLEHDGYVSVAYPTTWNELHNILATDDTFFASRLYDDYVRLGVFPEERDYYLRFYVPDEDDPAEQWADWDFTGSEEMASEIAELARSLDPEAVVVEPAKEFFDRRG